MSETLTKQCSECNVDQDLKYFPKNKLGRLGRHSICKVCRNRRNKKRYHADLINQRKIKAEQARRTRAQRKADGEISRDYSKWLNLKPDLVGRVEVILERCTEQRAKTLCFQIMNSGQDKWKRFSMSFEGDALLAEYSGV